MAMFPFLLSLNEQSPLNAKELKGRKICINVSLSEQIAWFQNKRNICMNLTVIIYAIPRIRKRFSSFHPFQIDYRLLFCEKCHNRYWSIGMK